MDNYFSVPKVIAKLREKGIGMVGTSRPKSNWPPKSLKSINIDKANFNEFYWLIDEHSTLVARWKDNGMVLCCSTVHRVNKVIPRLRKKPRPTATNTSHLKEVWGDDGYTTIKIPTLIDDYNHWMGGVDMSDQFIAYYHPDLRCFRTWIPMFLQLISIIRSNSYLVYKSQFNNKPRTRVNVLSHKSFTLAMIQCLLQKAEHLQRQSDDIRLTTTGAATLCTTTTNTPARRAVLQSAPPHSITTTASLLSFNSVPSAASKFSSSRKKREKHKRIRMIDSVFFSEEMQNKKD